MRPGAAAILDRRRRCSSARRRAACARPAPPRGVPAYVEDSEPRQSGYRALRSAGRRFLRQRARLNSDRSIQDRGDPTVRWYFPCDTTGYSAWKNLLLNIIGQPYALQLGKPSKFVVISGRPSVERHWRGE